MRKIIFPWKPCGLILTTVKERTPNITNIVNEYMDFTFDPVRFPPSEMLQFVDTLHANNQHYIPITDPGIAISPGISILDD